MTSHDQRKAREEPIADLQKLVTGWTSDAASLAATPLIDHWSVVVYPGVARKGESPEQGLLQNLHLKRHPPKGINVEGFVMRIRETATTAATRATSNACDRSADRNRPAGVLAPEPERAPSSWPFNPNDVTPLEWWRTMPADHLGDAQLSYLRATVSKISVMKDRQWLSALQGDAAASIAIAIGTMPIDQVTLEVDLAMSALALGALDGSAGAALVMSHILRQTPLDHPFGRELSASWLALNLHRALNAKRRLTKPRLQKTSYASHHRHTFPRSPVPA